MKPEAKGIVRLMKITRLKKKISGLSKKIDILCRESEQERILVFRFKGLYIPIDHMLMELIIGTDNAIDFDMISSQISPEENFTELKIRVKYVNSNSLPTLLNEMISANEFREYRILNKLLSVREDNFQKVRQELKMKKKS